MWCTRRRRSHPGASRIYQIVDAGGARSAGVIASWEIIAWHFALAATTTPRAGDRSVLFYSTLLGGNGSDSAMGLPLISSGHAFVVHDANPPTFLKHQASRTLAVKTLS